MGQCLGCHWGLLLMMSSLTVFTSSLLFECGNAQMKVVDVNDTFIRDTKHHKCASNIIQSISP